MRLWLMCLYDFKQEEKQLNKLRAIIQKQSEKKTKLSNANHAKILHYRQYAALSVLYFFFWCSVTNVHGGL